MAVEGSLVLLRRWWQALVLAVSSLLLGTGLGVSWLGGDGAPAWLAATLLGLLQATVSLSAAVYRRQASVDVIAWLALVGSLVVDELFAGAVITVMLATGVLLEARAEARARRELSLLVQRSPRTARRRTAAGLAEVPVVVGDRLVVGAGEIVPADGRLTGPAVLDESALTGEPLPVRRLPRRRPWSRVAGRSSRSTAGSSHSPRPEARIYPSSVNAWHIHQGRKSRVLTAGTGRRASDEHAEKGTGAGYVVL